MKTYIEKEFMWTPIKILNCSINVFWSTLLWSFSGTVSSKVKFNCVPQTGMDAQDRLLVRCACCGGLSAYSATCFSHFRLSELFRSVTYQFCAGLIFFALQEKVLSFISRYRHLLKSDVTNCTCVEWWQQKRLSIKKWSRLINW